MNTEDRLGQLEANMDVALGRLNAVHAGLLTVSRFLPSENLSPAAQAVAEAAEAIHADALATPLPDDLLKEMQRVLLELAGVLRGTHDQTQATRPASL